MMVLNITTTKTANGNNLNEYERYITALIDHHDRTLTNNSFADRQLNCLARNIYYEARGERVIGQLAVANVTMNRTSDGNICSTVYKPGQFSWTRNRNRNPTGDSWRKAQVLSWLVLNQPELIVDVTENSQYFHSGRLTPRDFRTFTRTATIGNHRFYRQFDEVAEADK